MGLTKISIDSEYLKNKSEVHILPCKIYFNGESDVKSFFSNNIIKNEKFQTKREDNIEVLEAGIRGRPLNGLKIPLNEDLFGFVVSENKEDKNIEISNSFTEINSWQLDQPDLSSKTDSLCKSMNWFDIAKIIHTN